MKSLLDQVRKTSNQELLIISKHSLNVLVCTRNTKYTTLMTDKRSLESKECGSENTWQ